MFRPKNPKPMTKEWGRMVEDMNRYEKKKRREREAEMEGALDAWLDNLEQELEKEMCSKDA